MAGQPPAKTSSTPKQTVARYEGLITLPTYEELCGEDDTLPSDFQIQRQQRNCLGFLSFHLRAYKCSPCMSKLKGFVCSFRHIRSWVHRRSNHELVGGPLFCITNDDPPQLTYRNPSFPTEFNRPPAPDETVNLRTLIARALGPLMRAELQWYDEDPNVHFIGRRIELHTRCDYCAVTLIGAAWMCQQCGNEACLRCFEILDSCFNTDLPPLGIHKHADWLKQIQTCTKWNGGRHNPASHIKISHLTRNEIQDFLSDMDVLWPQGSCAPQPAHDTSSFSDLSQYLFQPPGDHSDPYYQIPVAEFDADPTIFNKLWSAGQVIVVTGMMDRFELRWTPEYFTSKYAEEACNMLDSNAPHHPPRPTTVGQFFLNFGQTPSANQTVWKLRVSLIPILCSFQYRDSLLNEFLISSLCNYQHPMSRIGLQKLIFVSSFLNFMMTSNVPFRSRM